MQIWRISWPMVRDAIAVAAVAVLTVQALRRWCGDSYRVPTGSMEPVLHGHARSGDNVFVDKLASGAACARHDIVVVEQPREFGPPLVKRIAASGDDRECWIDIRQGDIWLGPDKQNMQREVKDPLLARGQRVLWASAPGSRASEGMLDLDFAHRATSSPAGNGSWQLPPMAGSVHDARVVFSTAARDARRRRGDRVLPEGCIGTAKPVDAGYIDATGARGATGNDVSVTDCGMELEMFRVAGEVLATVETRSEALTFHWQPMTGRVVLWRNGEDVAETKLSLGPQGATRLEFGLLDDRAFFCLDGARDQLFMVPRRADWQADWENGLPGGTRSLVYVGVLGAAADGMSLAAMRAFHDVFAWREPVAGLPDQPGGWPRHVPPGMWFLLGDSAFDSRDSRHFGAVPRSSFRGRPRFVVGPWPRCRWLTP